MHPFRKIRRFAIAALCCGAAAAQAAVVTQAAFVSTSVIDFETGPSIGFSYGATYAAQGVADIDLCNDGVLATGPAPASTTAGSSFSPTCTAPEAGGSITFASPVARVGFDISTLDAANTLVRAFLGGVLVGQELFDTFGSGFDGSFAGVEFAGGFDRIELSVPPHFVFVIDNLRFDPLTVVPEPGSLALAGLGLLALVGRRRRA